MVRVNSGDQLTQPLAPQHQRRAMLDGLFEDALHAIDQPRLGVHSRGEFIRAALDAPGAAVYDLAPVNCREIAAEGDVARQNIQPNALGFKWPAPLVELKGIVAEDGHVSGVATHAPPRRNGIELPREAIGGQKIEIRHILSFERGLTGQLGNRPVAQAVTDENDHFAAIGHKEISFRICEREFAGG
jgi:hypothetical protein